MAFPATLPFRVFAARPADLEAGYAPFHEGSFATKEEAQQYVSEWNRIYADSEVEFFIEA